MNVLKRRRRIESRSALRFSNLDYYILNKGLSGKPVLTASKSQWPHGVLILALVLQATWVLVPVNKFWCLCTNSEVSF